MENLEQSSASELKLITLHLGNGCSACAIKGGKSLDTSMGLTPLQGLIMGTRCGDIDPAIVFYLLRKEKNLNQESVESIENLLNEKSGLKGLCGANDMRSILKLMKEKNDDDAKQAFQMFCYRIRQYIGSYFVTLGGCDAIIFTAGIGENSPDVRREVCKGLECIGVQIDNNLNHKVKANKITDISSKESRIRVLIVPTDEERQIAIMGLKLLEKAST
jgi:acetate kinase